MPEECLDCGNSVLLLTPHGDCPACLLLEEFGTLDIPGSVYANATPQVRLEILELEARIMLVGF